MTDYWAVILNGLFTGIGVILAHELYDAFKKYRSRIKNEVIDKYVINSDRLHRY